VPILIRGGGGARAPLCALTFASRRP